MTAEEASKRQGNVRAWALAQVGAAYVYGATGGQCAPSLRREQIRQYPQHQQNIMQYCPVLRGDSAGCEGCRHYGKAAYDCAQLTRMALRLVDIHLPSGASSQWRCGLLVGHRAMDGQAAGQLCLVFRRSRTDSDVMDHVGLCLGDGRVVDARSHHRGVVISNISDYPWTHYALPWAIQQSDVRPLVPGSSGEEVRRLQQLLMQKGHPLPRFGADGKFGPETSAALRDFQMRSGMAVIPEAGPQLMKRLEQAAPRELSLEERVRRLEDYMKAQQERMSA